MYRAGYTYPGYRGGHIGRDIHPPGYPGGHIYQVIPPREGSQEPHFTGFTHPGGLSGASFGYKTGRITLREALFWV